MSLLRVSAVFLCDLRDLYECSFYRFVYSSVCLKMSFFLTLSLSLSLCPAPLRLYWILNLKG